MKSVIQFGQYLNRDKDSGNFDIEEGVQRFTAEATNYVQLHANDQEVCATAVNAVLSKNPGVHMNKEAVITMAVAEIVQGNVSIYQAVKRRVVEAIDSDPRYTTSIGAGGGLYRMNDAEFAVFQETGNTPRMIEIEKNKAKKAKKSETAPSV